MDEFIMIVAGMFAAILLLAFGIAFGQKSYEDKMYSELIKQPNITCMEMLQVLESEEEK